MNPIKDITGQTFGRLLVVSLAYANPRAHWKCKCICGTETVASGSHLRAGDSRSCGCLTREILSEKATTHGGSKTPEYRSWQAMMARCYNRNHDAYGRYGGAGITVCARWRHSFATFLLDMGARPSLGHSIERRNNKLGYFPRNCIWGTDEQQSNNRRTNHVIEFGGESLTAAQWGRRLGIQPQKILARLGRYGWPVERALLPIDGRGRR